MKATVLFGLGVAAGIVISSAALMLHASREQAALEGQINALRQNLAQAEQAAQRDREALHTTQEELASRRGPKAAPSPVASNVGSEATAILPINSAIMNYLGDPMSPPANLDPKYSGEQILSMFKTLCAARGVKIAKIAVDSTEFPFVLHGVLENGRDFFRQIDAELRAIPGYSYSGSVGSGKRDGMNYFSLSVTPTSVYPREQAEAIHRRLMLRLQMIAAAWTEPRL